MTEPSISPAPGCPVAHRTLPLDGTPHAPSPSLAAWRDEAPALPFRYPDGHEGWIVTRHDLGLEVMVDRRFDTNFRGFFEEAAEGAEDGTENGSEEKAPAYLPDETVLEAVREGVLIHLHGDQHTRVRRAVTGRYSVKAARGHRERIAEIVERQLERFVEQPRPIDLARHFARPITTRVHALVLGIPDEHVQRFDDHFGGGEPPSDEGLFDALRKILDAKRASSAADVLSDLVTSELSTAEIEGLALTVMGTGRDAVEYAIGTAVVQLLTNRDQWDLLRDDPGLMPRAVEEIMRVGAMHIVLTPVTAREDVAFDGLEVSAGQSVAVSAVAVNRDERFYDRPDEFDITRDPTGHLGFGHGIHVCLGQQLARVEIAEALTALVARLPGLRLVDAGTAPTAGFLYRNGPVVVDW
jgi:cytochrome P450